MLLIKFPLFIIKKNCIDKFKLYLSDKYSDISFEIELSLNNIGLQNKIFTFPYICSFLLKRLLKEFKPKDFIK